MNEEQEKQLKEWGVKLPKEKKQFNITHLIVAGFIGSLITGMVLTLIIVAGLSSSLITDGQCDDIIQMRLENNLKHFISKEFMKLLNGFYLLELYLSLRRVEKLNI